MPQSGPPNILAMSGIIIFIVLSLVITWFAARRTRAREEAILTNRPVAADTDAAGYGFSSFDGAAWTPLTSTRTRSSWPARPS